MSDGRQTRRGCWTRQMSDGRQTELCRTSDGRRTAVGRQRAVFPLKFCKNYVYGGKIIRIYVFRVFIKDE
jgi:hypothetical protein